jgi:hypothetical protein
VKILSLGFRRIEWMIALSSRTGIVLAELLSRSALEMPIFGNPLIRNPGRCRAQQTRINREFVASAVTAERAASHGAVAQVTISGADL